MHTDHTSNKSLSSFPILHVNNSVNLRRVIIKCFVIAIINNKFVFEKTTFIIECSVYWIALLY